MGMWRCVNGRGGSMMSRVRRGGSWRRYVVLTFAFLLSI